MRQIISLVDITPLAKRLWTWYWTASGSLLTTAACLQDHRCARVCLSVFPECKPNRFSDDAVTEAQDSKGSASTTHAAAEQDQVLAASCSRGRLGRARRFFVSSVYSLGPKRTVLEDLVSLQGCPWIMARRARFPSPCGAALRWPLQWSSPTTQSCASIHSWSTPM